MSDVTSKGLLGDYFTPPTNVPTSTLPFEQRVRGGQQLQPLKGAPQTSEEMYAPLRCGCGAALKLACAAACSKPTIERRASPRASSKRGPYTYKPKTCSCGATFTPTGPRSIRCSACSR